MLFWRCLQEKEKLAFSGQDRIPVLVDGGKVVSDAWDIACYLEETCPDRRSLFGGDIGRAEARFFNEWIAALQFARCVSDYPILDDSDPLYEWRQRMLDLYDGLGRSIHGSP